MKFLSIFRTRKENKADKDDVYMTLVIKSLLQEQQDLKNRLDKIESTLININNNDNCLPKRQKLTKLESTIYRTSKFNTCNSLDDLSKLTKLKVSSIRVYCSKIRKKGYKLDIS